MYYLQSRYYDSSACRFLNTDTSSVLHKSYSDLLGLNLFIYCYNNPVNSCDYSGMAISFLKIYVDRYNRKGNYCAVYLFWTGPNMYNAWKYSSMSATNGSILKLKTYDKVYSKSIRPTAASYTGTVLLVSLYIPVSVKYVTIIINGLYGYNLMKGYWEVTKMQPLRAKIK